MRNRNSFAWIRTRRKVTGIGGQRDTTRCTWVSTCSRECAAGNGKTNERCAGVAAAGSWRRRKASMRSMPSKRANHATAKRGSGGRERLRLGGTEGSPARLEARELLARVDAEERFGLVVERHL